MKKAIFGGTFDPIHLGHIHIAYEALETLELDNVVFVPSGNPPHKLNRNITDSSIRYEMVQMAIRDEKRFQISSYEMDNKNLSYTYKTLEYFNELERDTDWYFLTGVDCLMELNSWKNVCEILKLCKLIVFGRSGYSKTEIKNRKINIEKQYNCEIAYLDAPILEISSTNIRNMVSNNRYPGYMMKDGVYNTILELGLYK